MSGQSEKPFPNIAVNCCNSFSMSGLLWIPFTSQRHCCLFSNTFCFRTAVRFCTGYCCHFTVSTAHFSHIAVPESERLSNSKYAANLLVSSDEVIILWGRNTKWNILKFLKTAWKSQNSSWTLLDSFLPAFFCAPRGRTREAIDSDSPPTRLHITLLIGIISDWSSTALAMNSGVNRLQHVARSWLSPSVNKSRGLFFLSLSLSRSVSAYCEDWARHTATKGKEANRPGSSFTLDRLMEAVWWRKSAAKYFPALLMCFFSLNKEHDS